jgi:hypothetical protein
MFQIRRGNSVSGFPHKRTMKNINWKGIAVTAGIALGVFLLYPMIRPFAQKIPVIGKWL